MLLSTEASLEGDKAVNAEIKELAEAMIQNHKLATAEMKSALEAENLKSADARRS